MADKSKANRRVVAGCIAAVLLVAAAVLAWYARVGPNPSPVPSGSTGSIPTREFPSASTTGVRPGVTLVDSGPIVVEKPGTIIQGLRVKGRIEVRADDVVIRDTLVQGGGSHYPIRIAKGVKNALIEHVEVQNEPGGGICIFFNGGSGTVRYANVHTATDGIRIQADDVTIEDSYIHDLKRIEGGHHDSIQIRAGNNVTIQGNSLLPYVARTDDPMNAALQVGSVTRGPLVNLQVADNFMDGGNYTINGGSELASASFLRNVFGPHARYGVRSTMPAQIVWRDNTMAHTGEPAG